MTPLNAATRRMTLEGVADIDAAEALKGAVVMLAAEDVPPAKPGEFYYYEAIGCEVFLTDGSRLGTIEEVFSNGAQDIWVVRDGATRSAGPGDRRRRQGDGLRRRVASRSSRFPACWTDWLAPGDLRG